ncbi:MAG: DUF2283 domain-containing protein [Candidatus Stahlbacteria bacterium]|nr:DUF2283 domain-containing protein [Candidatus Stahlbacteria bacterium]
MKVSYDSEADAVYITLKGHGVDHTARIGPDIAIDYGPDGEIHGIEILAAREHLGLKGLRPDVTIENLRPVGVSS